MSNSFYMKCSLMVNCCMCSFLTPFYNNFSTSKQSKICWLHHGRLRIWLFKLVVLCPTPFKCFHRFQVSVVVWKLLLAKHMELLHKIAYTDQPFVSKKNTSGRYTPYSNVDSFLKVYVTLYMCLPFTRGTLVYLT